MFECTIELLWCLPTPDGEPRYLVVGIYNFQPGLAVGDAIWVYLRLGEQEVPLKAKVVAIKREVYAPSDHMRVLGDEVARCGVFKLRVFVEAEDRSALLAITEQLQLARVQGVCR